MIPAFGLHPLPFEADARQERAMVAEFGKKKVSIWETDKGIVVANFAAE